MKEKTWKHIWYASILLYAVTLFYSLYIIFGPGTGSMWAWLLWQC